MNIKKETANACLAGFHCICGQLMIQVQDLSAERTSTGRRTLRVVCLKCGDYKDYFHRDDMPGKRLVADEGTDRKIRGKYLRALKEAQEKKRCGTPDA